mmetsp:Transcript_26748/g.72275  ORF Transcript_26748/g.72275 Transcript_26748/m.72275 type:complete len:536 (+) Transcript_26748:333-1940(+)|eukprot:CAMPEP_0202367238 /NCGR_PEP_ID=MMETSP1126-20121109/17533_1 /ASSEMBLY_ACC=CAM_ASM_000457 /TAXON_ID=3047 /ORGANISM="Dunaliella tertiolecta, Strain CCMP1320" /LENGTH=535 /DNA_ID=CAMNT_0048962455 /DNA_START=145 /DNA_END=1752 /DNA_ORIENTATION=+
MGVGYLGSAEVPLPSPDYYKPDFRSSDAGPLMEKQDSIGDGVLHPSSIMKRRTRLAPMQDAWEQEAAGLGDADLDTQKEGALRVSPHRSYNRVFGNTLYEEARQQIDEEQGQGQQQANAQASQYGDSFTADPVEPHTPYIAGMPGTFEEGHVDHGAYAQGGGDLVNEDGDGLGTGPGSHGGRTSWGMGRPESIRRSMRGSFNSRAAQAAGTTADYPESPFKQSRQDSSRLQARRNNLVAEEDVKADQGDNPTSDQSSTHRRQGRSGAQASVWEGQLQHLLDLQQREECVHRPGPIGGDLIRCYIKRSKAFLGQTKYQMFLENGNLFLLAGRLRKKTKNSHYVISTDPEELKRDTDSCLAKLKANYMGSQFTLWQRAGDTSVKNGYGQEGMSLVYEAGKRSGPRGVRVVLPLPGHQWPPSEESQSLGECLDKAKHKELPQDLESKLIILSNRPPTWDKDLMAYTLNFDKRIKIASVKNLQLVSWDHNSDAQGENVMLQFGKLGEDLFALDFGYPFTIESAFALALATLDSKLVYTL